MENANTASGLVGRSAHLAHTFVRDQVAALLAPVYLIKQARSRAAGAAGADHATSRPAAAVGVHISATTRS